MADSQLTGIVHQAIEIPVRYLSVSLDCKMECLWHGGGEPMDVPSRPQAQNATRHNYVNVNHIAAELVDISINTTANLNKFAPTGTFQHLVVCSPVLLLHAGRRQICILFALVNSSKSVQK